MRKKIIEMLATKFEGVSENILGRIADKVAKTVESENDLEDAVGKVTFQSVLESYADSRVTEAQKTAVENYKKKHNIVEEPIMHTTAESADKSSEQKFDDIPAWAKGIIESNKALEAKIKGIESEKVGISRKAKLQQVVADLPKALGNRYMKDFDRLQFQDDEDFQNWIDEISPEIADVAKDLTKPRFGTPKSATATKGEDIDPMLKARIDERAKADVASSAIQGLPK